MHAEIPDTMIYIFLLICVVIHSLIGVIFKYYESYGINNLKAIVINYFVCVLVAWIWWGEFPISPNHLGEDWFPYALGLGFFLIGGFTISALCFQYLGLAFTTVIQKMSLLIPVSVAIFIFHEPANFLKISGIIAAIVSIVLINSPIQLKSGTDRKTRWKIIWIPLITFLIGGIIESALLVVNEKELLKGADVSFVASLFFIAGCLGLLFLLISKPFVKRKPWKKRDIAGGLVLGSFNFFSIYLLLFLLQNGMDGSVLYPMNNIGVVALSAAIGFFVFKERLNLWKSFGLLCSILAIALILLSESQVYAG